MSDETPLPADDLGKLADEINDLQMEIEEGETDKRLVVAKKVAAAYDLFCERFPPPLISCTGTSQRYDHTAWYKWAEANLVLSRDNLQRMLNIGQAKDSAKELKAIRERTRDRVAKHRAARKAAAEAAQAAGLVTPPPSAQPEADQPGDPAQSGDKKPDAPDPINDFATIIHRDKGGLHIQLPLVLTALFTRSALVARLSVEELENGGFEVCILKQPAPQFDDRAAPAAPQEAA